MVNCPKCGTPVITGANYCYHCGVKLAAESADEPEYVRIYGGTSDLTDDDIKIYTPSEHPMPSAPSDLPTDSPEDAPASVSAPSPDSETAGITSAGDEADDSDVKVVESKVRPGETHIWTVAEIREIRKLHQQKEEELARSHAEEAEAEKRSRRPSRIQLVSAVLAAVLLLSLCTFWLLPKSSGYNSRSSLLVLVHNASGSMTLYKNGHQLSSIAADPGYIAASAINTSGNVVAALTRSDSGNGSLYYSSGHGIASVHANVLSMEMASGSGALVYLIDTGNSHDLYLYDGSSSRLIATGVSGTFCISPNGKTIGYTKVSPGNRSVSNGYIYSEGTTELLGPDLTPFAVADKAAFIYYFQKDGNDSPFYVRQAQSSDEPTRLASSPRNIYFNASLTEVVFTDQNVTYFSEKAHDRSIVSQNGDSSILLPYGCSFVQVHGPSVNASIYSASSFKDGYIMCGGSLFYLSKRMKSTKLASNYDQVYLASDGHTIYYLTSGEIRSIDARKGSAPSVLAGDVYSFTITANGKDIYYVSNDYELLYLHGNKAPLLLSETPDVVNLYSRHIFDKDKFVYSIGNIVYIADGTNIQAAPSDLDYINTISANGFCMFVQGLKNNENVTGLSGDGKNFIYY